MIQRIQSIWLFLATLTLVLMFIFPLLNGTVNGVSVPMLYTKGYVQNWDSGEFITAKIQYIYPLLITNIVIALICFINIFNFRKRALQKRLAIVSIILIGGFAFWCGIYAQKIEGGINAAHFGAGAYLPALAILFIVLAIFGINKDERLIRSAERLR